MSNDWITSGIDVSGNDQNLTQNGGTEGKDDDTQDIQIFWDVMPCRWVNSCKRFEG